MFVNHEPQPTRPLASVYGIVNSQSACHKFAVESSGHVFLSFCSGFDQKRQIELFVLMNHSVWCPDYTDIVWVENVTVLSLSLLYIISFRTFTGNSKGHQPSVTSRPFCATRTHIVVANTGRIFMSILPV